jgi:hypothetical protein
MTSQPEHSVSTQIPDPEDGQDTLARDPAGPDQELAGQDVPGQGPFGPDVPGGDVPGQGPLGPDVPGGDVPGQGPLGPDVPGGEVPGQGPTAPAPGRPVVDRIAPLREASSAGSAGQDAAGQDAAAQDVAAGAAAEGEAAQERIAEPGGSAAEAAVPGSSGVLEEGAGVPAAALAAQQWPGILALFVDDPRGAVERAAAAAREQAAALAAALEREQATLRDSWQADASTEDLRTALQQYRSFCGRLEAWA